MCPVRWGPQDKGSLGMGLLSDSPELRWGSHVPTLYPSSVLLSHPAKGSYFSFCSLHLTSDFP